jgi:hypothetical protein
VSTFEVFCEHCGSRYVIPIGLREQLRGRTVTCAWCMREWTPLRVELHDPSARGRGVSFGEPPFPLHPYLQVSTYAPAPAPATAESPVVRSTTQFVRVGPTGAPTNLRVSASGPEFELKAVYDWATGAFSSARGCHLELPRRRASRSGDSSSGGRRLQCKGSTACDSGRRAGWVTGSTDTTRVVQPYRSR